jgi:Arc/MetJ-type ribon-helix-helix transcriptional regulator
MNNSLPLDIQQRIDAQLATGSFQSEEEVLREALATLERRQHGLTQVREMVAIAEADAAAGRVAPFNREDVKRDVHERLEKRGIRG